MIVHQSEGIIICDKCEFGSLIPENLRTHIVAEHTVYISQELGLEITDTDKDPLNSSTIETTACDLCEFSSNSREDLELHMNIHKAEIIAKALHTCQQCRCSISSIEQKLQCDKCYYFFHKYCTDRR